METTPNIEKSVTKEIRKNRFLSFLEAGPQTYGALQDKYGHGSTMNRIRKELLAEVKIEQTYLDGKPAYQITKKGKNSLLSFGIIGMLINEILGQGGIYHEDYSVWRGSMYYNQLSWGIQDDLVYDKRLEKYNPITKETANNLHQTLYRNIIQDAKNRNITLDESKTGRVILGFMIDYQDLVHSIKEKSLDYMDAMTDKEENILAKYEDGTATKEDIDEQKRLRIITKAKMRKKQ